MTQTSAACPHCGNNILIGLAVIGEGGQPAQNNQQAQANQQAQGGNGNSPNIRICPECNRNRYNASDFDRCKECNAKKRADYPTCPVCNTKKCGPKKEGGYFDTCYDCKGNYDTGQSNQGTNNQPAEQEEVIDPDEFPW